MPTPATKQITRSVAAITDAVTSLIDAVTRAATPTAPARSGGGRGSYHPLPPAKAKRRSARLKKSQQGVWLKYTPKERAERVRKMLAGRGLKPKSR
jgi:hypothetical protein